MTNRFSRALVLNGVLVALSAAVLAGLSHSAAAQTSHPSEVPFAVGAGGYAVTDTGRAADVKTFSTGGFRIFADVELEPGVFLQARYEKFILPGSPVPRPRFSKPRATLRKSM